MTVSATINAVMNPKVGNVLKTLSRMLNVDIDLTNSKSFKAVMECPDGNFLNFRVSPTEQGAETGVVHSLDVGSLVEETSATGTLVNGVLDLTLANATTDRLVVRLVTSHGTAGVLSVKRKSATQVTVQSWLGGTGIQALDISDIAVYNIGPALY